MNFKEISDLSFFSAEQKELFRSYIIYEDGTVFNRKTKKNVSKTLHGVRGYVSNLSVYVDGKRKQRQIVIHRAVADLFIRPMKDGEKIRLKDDDKKNTHFSNIEYVKTEKKKNIERIEKNKTEMGITDTGRVCVKCGQFKSWKMMGGKKSAVCKMCANKMRSEYQKSINYSRLNVKYETYAERLADDNPVDVNGFVGIHCALCNDIVMMTRTRVLNRLKTISRGYTPKPIICKQCKKEKNDGKK